MSLPLRCVPYGSQIFRQCILSSLGVVDHLGAGYVETITYYHSSNIGYLAVLFEFCVCGKIKDHVIVLSVLLKAPLI